MLMVRPAHFLLFAVGALALAATAGAQEPLTGAEAWRRVLAASPELAVLAEERDAVAGEAEQARRLPNPQISAELANAIGTGAYQGVRGSETTVQLSQTYERASKRDLRRRFAETSLPVSEADLAVKLADLRLRTARAFTTVLVAQAQTALRLDAVELASRIVETVRRQHEAGQASGLELARAKVGLTAAQVAADAAATALAQARLVLAAQWGGIAADFPGVVGSLEVADTLPDAAALAANLEAAPDLQRFPAEERRRELAVAVEKSALTRDVTVAGGVRYLREGRDAAFVVGVSVPLLLNHQNQGAIRAAKARQRQVPLEAAKVRLALRAELADNVATLVSAQREAAALTRDVLPAAEEVVRQNEAALAQGRTTLLSILEAQRTLLDARERRLDAVSRFLQAQAVVERLTRAVEPSST